MSHTKEDLKELQSKTLEEKIQISTARIIEWYEHWEGQVYVSFSGGKDSTVLLDLVRRLYPDVVAVFSDTGLEYPEIRKFVKTIDNVDWIAPQKYDKEKRQWIKYVFADVIRDVGYPVISKNVAQRVWAFNHAKDKINSAVAKMFKGVYGGRKDGEKSQYNIEKWAYLLNSDFLISDKCCQIMKKNPTKKYGKKTNKKAIIGTMTYESRNRRKNWLQTGCNAFEAKEPISTPIAFWTEQDILQYIKEYNLEYAPVYGNLVELEDGTLHFTKCQRTGCIFCGFGCQVEDNPNRFQRLAETHPKLYDYCINGGQYSEDGVWQPGSGGLEWVMF